MTINLSTNIQNKLKTEKGKSIYIVEDWNNIPNQKFDRVLYSLHEDDNEEVVFKNLINICNSKGLILVCSVPEINKRLSNGVIKQNKDIFEKIMSLYGIERFWFLSSEKDDHFDFLIEQKKY